MYTILSPILSFPFDGVTENRPPDANYRDVTIVSDPIFNKVAKFSRTTRSYIIGAELPTPTIDLKRTVSYWIYTSSGRTQFIHGSRQYAIGWSAYMSAGNTLFIYLHGKSIRSSTPIPSDTWVHICEKTNGDTILLYVNNELSAEGPVNVYEDPTNTSYFLFPEYYVGANAMYPTQYPFDGLMYDFRIYDTTLDESQVTELYNIGKAGPETIVPVTIFQETIVPVTIAQETIVPETIDVSWAGSTSLSLRVEGDERVDYTIVVDSQKVSDTRSGDIVNFTNLEPGVSYQCRLYK